MTDYRDDKGRFLTGNPGSTGRPPKAKEQAVLDAVKAAFSPDEIAAGLRDVYDLAKKQGSTRGMLNALELAIVYSVGKPATNVNINNDNSTRDFLLTILADRTPVLPPREGTIDVFPVERPKLTRDD